LFPASIAGRSAWVRSAYGAGVLLLLVLWLLPLLGVAITSVRSVDDLNRGNYWGWPVAPTLIGNYVQVFAQTSMARFFVNSLVITVPSVFLVLVLSTLNGFVLSRAV